MTEYEPFYSITKEIRIWRYYFLDGKFRGAFKHIPSADKNRLTSYFMSIPHHIFTTPEEEWDNCLSALLQRFGNKL